MFKRAALLAAMAVTLAAPAAMAFDSDKDGYSLDFPSKWQTREHFMSTSVIGLSPLESAHDAFAENVNVVVEELGAGVPLATYTKASGQNLAKFLNQYKLIENKTVRLHGHDAQRLVYEHAQGQFKLRALVYLLVEGDRGYVLTCTAERASYPKFQGQFEKICQSFALAKTEE